MAEDNPLAAALGAAVAEVEDEYKDGTPVAATQEPVHLVRESFTDDDAAQAAATQAGGNGADDENAGAGGAGDFFGIQYKSMHRKKDVGYKVPSGPSFQDEKEFERELAKSDVKSMMGHSAAAAAADDDEFDHEFDFDDGDNQEEAAAVAAAAVDRARKAREQREAEEARILAEMRREAAAGAGAAVEETPAAAVAADEAAEEAVAPRASAADALRKVQEQLRADEEAKRADEMAAQERAFEENKMDLNAGLGGFIEEGDEEEEESDEEDEAAMAAAQAAIAEREAAAAATEAALGTRGAGIGAGAGVAADAAVVAAETEWGATDEARKAEEDEWARVETIRADEMATRKTRHGVTIKPKSGRQARVSYRNAAAYLLNVKDLKPYTAHHVSDQAPGTGSCFGMCGPAKLANKGVDQRKKLFAIAGMPYEPQDEMHHRMLQSVYKALSGDELDCPLPSANWESIGFQGANPLTDLRGCGMLSVLNMLYLVDNHYDFAHKLLVMSRANDAHFPLMASGINVTARSLSAVETGKLNAIAVKDDNNVLATYNKFWASLFFKLFQLHCDGVSTVAAFNTNLAAAQEYCGANPKRAITEFEAAMSKNLFSEQVQRGDGFGELPR